MEFSNSVDFALDGQYHLLGSRVGAKKVSVQYCTFTVLDCTITIFSPYFLRTLIVLLLHLLTYCNRHTFPVPYITIKVGVFSYFYGDREQCWRVDAGLERTTICELLPVEQ